jgi:hypothetical protein
MLRHGFHPPEARQRWSIPFAQYVHPEGRTPDTDSYLTLIPADHDETYTARMLRRIPRTDVAEYHKLPEDKGFRKTRVYGREFVPGQICIE